MAIDEARVEALLGLLASHMTGGGAYLGLWLASPNFAVPPEMRLNMILEIAAVADGSVGWIKGSSQRSDRSTQRRNYGICSDHRVPDR